MRYIGLDLHKQVLEVCALDGKGKHLFRMSVAVTHERGQPSGVAFRPRYRRTPVSRHHGEFAARKQRGLATIPLNLLRAGVARHEDPAGREQP